MRLIDYWNTDKNTVTTYFERYGIKGYSNDGARYGWCGKHYLYIKNKTVHSYVKKMFHDYLHDYGIRGAVKIVLHNILLKIAVIMNSVHYSLPCDLVIISMFGNRIEFNFYNKRVVLYSIEGSKKYKYLLQSGYFDFLKSPVIKESENSLITQYIEKDQVHIHSMYKRLILDYERYLTTCRPSKSYKMDSFVKENCKRTIDNVEYKDKEIILYPLHGDLHYENIIVANSNQNMYVIDYEHAGEYPFFFDLFVFAIMRFVSNIDSSLINAIICKNGDIHTLVSNLFLSVGEDCLSQRYFAYCIRMTFDLYISRNCINEMSSMKEKMFWGKKYDIVDNYLDHLLRETK